MSEYLIQSKTLTAIADAIREKTGASDMMTPEGMAAAIADIQAGGGFPNGTEWTMVELPDISNRIIGIAYLGGVWFASTYSSGLLVSNDGKNWRQSSIIGGTTYGTPYKIYYYKGIWILNGYYIGLYYSLDGENWIEHDGDSPKTIYECIDDSDVLIIAASNGVFCSTDGKAWSRHIQDKAVYNLRCVNGTWMAFTSENGVYYSTDGLEWSQSNITSGRLSAPLSNGNICLAFGDGNNKKSYYSTDGCNWNVVESIPVATQMVFGAKNVFSYTNNRWFYYISHEKAGDCYTSRDGITWTQCDTSELDSSKRFDTVMYKNGVYVGYSKTSSSYARIGLVYSEDGLKWYSSNITDGICGSVDYYDGVWIALITPGYADSSIYWSNDGKEWTVGLKQGYIDNIVYNGSVWITDTHYSSNGRTWKAIPFLSEIVGSSSNVGATNRLCRNGIWVGFNSQLNNCLFYSIAAE